MIDDNYEVDVEKDAKARKNNIKMLTILIVAFLIGILVRWDYISSEVSTTVSGYFDTKVIKNDTVTNLGN